MFWWCGAGGDGIWICGAIREAEGVDWGDGSGRAGVCAGVCAGVGGGGRESVGLGLEGSACGGRRSECLLCPVRVRRAGERRGVPGVRKSARRKGDGGGCSRPAMVGGGRWHWRWRWGWRWQGAECGRCGRRATGVARRENRCGGWSRICGGVVGCEARRLWGS